MRRRTLLPIVVLASLAANAHAQSDLTLPAVPLRPGVTADVHFAVHEAAAPCDGRVVLAVHGVAHSAASWEPFAERVLADGLAGLTVCKLVAMDLPGHGASGLPTGRVRFGSLTLRDYVAALRASLERLPALGIMPDTLLGHSQGGLLIQLTQKALLTQGASLQGLGITEAVLLASVGPRQVPWEFVDSGAAVPILARYIRVNRALGLHVAIPDAAWPSVFFSDLTGTVVGAPPAADVARYNSRESLVSSLQLVGLGFRRPSVPAGVLAPAHGTRLTVIALENDSLIRPHENTLLYEHLTGQPAGAAVRVVFGPGAIHDMHVADPDGLLAAVEAVP
jgi:pimeloyl-ACP methyl ester carboxylesterase